MPQFETISSFCHDPKNTEVLRAVDIFRSYFEEVTGQELEIPNTPPELIDINDKVGRGLDESIGEDFVIFDVLHKNKRTLLYINNAPKGSAILMYSAMKNKFNSNAVYEEYTVEDEQPFRSALKDAFLIA